MGKVTLSGGFCLGFDDDDDDGRGMLLRKGKGDCRLDGGVKSGLGEVCRRSSARNERMLAVSLQRLPEAVGLGILDEHRCGCSGVQVHGRRSRMAYNSCRQW